MSDRQRITLIEEYDGRWSAIEGDVGVASYGETRSEALEMLDEAVALHTGEVGHEPTDEGIRELGIDPDATGDNGLPEFMK